MIKRLLRVIDSNLWLVLVLSVFAWGPLLTPVYFFNAHDARHSIFFLVEFDQTFRDGYLWPRWSPDFAFGYGYPLFNLYAPLAFYAAEILHLLGLGFTAAVKMMYILATIGAGLGMYGFARRLYGPAAGVLAATVYMYAPFHLVEIFVRSAYAEFVALAIIPFLFWAFTELIAAPSPRRLALTALAYGLLALTHHTSFFTFTPLLMVYILFLITLKAVSNPSASLRASLQSLISNLLCTAAAGLLGIALAAIYLIPMLTEVRFIKLEQWTSGSYNYLQHFVYFSQFFAPDWGYGYSGVGLLDDFSFQLGIVAVVLFVFVLVFSVIHNYPHRNTALFFMGATLITIFIMSPLAETLWQVLPIASLVQFPWRLLAVTAFTMSIVAGALISIINYQLSMSNLQPFSFAQGKSPIPNLQSPISDYQLPPLYLLCLVAILGSFAYTVPQYTEIPEWTESPLAVINWDRASIVDRVGMVSVTEEQPHTSPMEPQYLNGEPLTTAGIIAGKGSLEILRHGGASDQIKVIADHPVIVQFYTYDYPGWQVTLNDKPIPHRAEPPFGLITVDIPAGEHILWLQMGSTPPRTIGTLTNLLAAVTIIGLLAFPLCHSPKLTIPQSTP